MIKKQPFKRYSLEDRKKETVSIWFNSDERAELDRIKLFIEQPKDGTAIKTLMMLGTKLLDDDKIVALVNTLFKNKRNNRRSGNEIIQ